MNESIVTGKKYRVRNGNGWDRISFWSKAEDTDIDIKDSNGTVTGSQTVQDFADNIGNMVQDMTGATDTTPGIHGLVPAPAAGDEKKVLSGAGTWVPSTPGYHFDTIADMNAALAAGEIPADGATIYVDEDVPGGNAGDTELSDTSINWVQNQVVTKAINNNAIKTDEQGYICFVHEED